MTHPIPRRAVLLALALCAPGHAADAQSARYFPLPGEAWERRAPVAVGMDSAAVAAAVAFAQANEINWSLDMAGQLRTNTAQEPYPEILGPVMNRGHQNGIILRNGYIVAEWGDTRRLDMTFSVAKSYLSTVAGIAFDRGLIKDLDEPVGRTVRDGGFDAPHNAKITWRMHLTQTSEWEGTLWDKPDVADRRRGRDRALNEPGTFWEYNDVRVNRLALSLLRLFRQPLPEVLEREIMDPIGASDTWVWHGYRNSFVEMDGQRMQSVSGGGHWGGGVWANTRDHARFGYLMLRRGNWSGKQLVSERWIEQATSPTPLRPVYGFMWWLNTDGQQFAAASRRSYFALGAGGNAIWIDPEHDLVVVTRWLSGNRLNEFMRLVTASVVAPVPAPAR
jgi:CubicO group peptidase (beta-lactamase class C family)